MSLKIAARTDICSFKVAILFLTRALSEERAIKRSRTLLEMTRVVESVPAIALFNKARPWNTHGLHGTLLVAGL